MALLSVNIKNKATYQIIKTVIGNKYQAIFGRYLSSFVINKNKIIPTAINKQVSLVKIAKIRKTTDLTSLFLKKQ